MRHARYRTSFYVAVFPRPRARRHVRHSQQERPRRRTPSDAATAHERRAHHVVHRRGGRGRPAAAARVRLDRVRRGRRAPRPAPWPAETRLEPRGVRGREGGRLPVVVPQPQVAAQRRDSQRGAASAQAGHLHPSAAQGRQVSTPPYYTTCFAYYVLHPRDGKG